MICIEFISIHLNFTTMILQVHANLRYKTTLFSADFKNITFSSVLTEMGICYTYSGTITDYLTPE